MKKTTIMMLGVSLVLSLPCFGQKKWTLEECIAYAKEHNIEINKDRLSKKSSEEDVKQSKSALAPSLSFSTVHQMGYRPFQQGAVVTDGIVTANTNKLSYNGNYGVNVNWTVWNGNKNRNTIKKNQFTAEQAELTVEQAANNIQEQIMMLYTEILYSEEAVNVNEQIADISRKNLERGKEMFKVGSLAKTDVAQLEAQVATDEYNVVNAKTQVQKYKLQLKTLLEITGEEEFDVAVPEATEEMALAAIPSLTETYNNAILTRPEIRNAQIGINASENDLKIAKAGYMPTFSLTGAVGTSNNTQNSEKWGKQLKTNLNSAIGVSVSIPIWDQRQTKTSVNKAKYAIETKKLELDNQKKQLWSSIETYWLNATTAQQKFKSSKVSVASAETSYELLNEQFKEGLKNIQELTTGKTTLLNSVQQKLENKYTTILDIEMLKFYSGTTPNP